MENLTTIDFINITSCLRYGIENCESDYLKFILNETLLKVEEIEEVC